MQLAPPLAALVGQLTGKKEEAGMLAGILGIGAMATDALKSPSTGLGIAESGMAGALNKNPEGIFGGALKEGVTFGEGINKLPESLGGAGWNAPESIFNFNPGKTKPIPWFL